jgi:hypothetical protein
MVMDLIYENNELNNKLYISDLNSITIDSLNSFDIGLIISLGCNIDNIIKDNVINIERISYSNILDQPEQIILHILNDTNIIINKAMKTNKNVLVHCIYGQSRSVTVTISYLMSIGFDLQSSIDKIKLARPCICINPGFLCQLLLLSKRGFDSLDIKVILKTIDNANSNHTDNINNDNDNDIICNECNHVVVSSSLILHPKLCDCLEICHCDNLYNIFLDKNIDPFWKGYKPINNNNNNNNNKNQKKNFNSKNISSSFNHNDDCIIIPFNEDNITKGHDKKRKIESAYICTNRRCKKELGIVKKGHLCNGFIEVNELIFLQRSKVTISRKVEK